jgi:glycine oxidase
MDRTGAHRAERAAAAADRSNLIRVMPAQGRRGLTHSTAKSFDVAVAGGGVIGLAVAWRAAQAGADVVVLDERREGAAWPVSAGMLAPVAEAEFGHDDLLALGLASAERWPAFAHELAAASGRDPGYRRCGTLVVARDRDEAEALERELDYRTGRELPVQRLLPTEARRREPALGTRVRLALDVPGDHAVDPRALRAALAEALRREGGELRDGKPVQDLGELRALGARAVVATGAWAGALAGVPVRPVKGQILRLRDPAGPGLLDRVVRLAESYVVPRGDGRYVLGATVEEQGFDETVTAGALHDLLRDAIEVVPGIAELELQEASAGLRPGTPDNAPVIGRGALDGLHWATGHYRHGVLLAPISAELVVGALAGEAVPAAFAAERFAADRRSALAEARS